MSALENIVDRAINYTNSILNRMPSYRGAAIAGLRKLHEALVANTPDDPALVRLAAYLESLDDKAPQSESALTPSERLL